MCHVINCRNKLLFQSETRICACRWQAETLQKFYQKKICHRTILMVFHYNLCHTVWVGLILGRSWNTDWHIREHLYLTGARLRHYARVAQFKYIQVLAISSWVKVTAAFLKSQIAILENCCTWSHLYFCHKLNFLNNALLSLQFKFYNALSILILRGG